MLSILYIGHMLHYSYMCGRHHIPSTGLVPSELADLPAILQTWREYMFTTGNS